MIRRMFAVMVRLVTGVRPIEWDAEDDRPRVFYANHTSHMDFVVVWAALPTKLREKTSPVAAEDYWGATPLRRVVACRFFRSTLIRRTGVTRDSHPIEQVGAVLESGRSVIIFPEGTRNSKGATGGFRPGIYHLAKRFPGIPLVPVYLENLSRILPKGSLLVVPLIAQVRLRDGIVLEPGEAKNDFLSRARLALVGNAETDQQD